MARRENQGLHIGLISMVVVCVLLLGLTYFFWSSADTRGKEAADLRSQLQDSKSATRNSTDENIVLKKLVGASEDDSIEAVRTQYDTDMSVLSALPEEERSYAKALATLRTNYFETKKQVEDLTKRQEELTASIDQIRTEENARVEEAKRGQTQARDDLAQEKQKYDEERARIVGEKEKLNSELTKSREQIASAEEKLRRAQAEFADEKKRIQTQLTVLRTRLEEYEKETFDVPDGKITYFNPRTGLVMINLGSSHGLRPQTSFGVFDADDSNLARAVKKGSIEIQRILGPTTAEAIVIDDQVANPLIAGDLIYTPLWAPGGRLRFGIAGGIDVDGDSQDDRDRLRQLIRLSGGIIDAEDDGPDGRPVGALTIQTRYLIVGETPEVALVAGQLGRGQRARAERYSEMISQASGLGIERITVQQLLNYLGYKAMSTGTVKVSDRESQ